MSLTLCVIDTGTRNNRPSVIMEIELDLLSQSVVAIATVRGDSSMGVHINSSCVILKVIYDLPGMDLGLYSGKY